MPNVLLQLPKPDNRWVLQFRGVFFGLFDFRLAGWRDAHDLIGARIKSLVSSLGSRAINHFRGVQRFSVAIREKFLDLRVSRARIMADSAPSSADVEAVSDSAKQSLMLPVASLWFLLNNRFLASNSNFSRSIALSNPQILACAASQFFQHIFCEHAVAPKCDSLIYQSKNYVLALLADPCDMFHLDNEFGAIKVDARLLTRIP